MHKFIVFAALALLLGGCASNNDVLINGAHYQSLDIHNQEQTKQVNGKAEAISRLVNFECSEADKGSEACGALKFAGVVIAADRIADIEAQEFKESKPVTGLNVQTQGLKTVAGGIPFASMGVVSYKAIDSDKGTTSISADNGSTVSTSHKEYHSQTTGDNSPPTITVDESSQPAPIEEPAEEEAIEEASDG